MSCLCSDTASVVKDCRDGTLLFLWTNGYSGVFLVIIGLCVSVGRSSSIQPPDSISVSM